MDLHHYCIHCLTIAKPEFFVTHSLTSWTFSSDALSSIASEPFTNPPICSVRDPPVRRAHTCHHQRHLSSKTINATGHGSRVVASRALQNCPNSESDSRVHDAHRRVRVFIDTDTDFDTESLESLSLRTSNCVQDADRYIDIVTDSPFPFPFPSPTLLPRYYARPQLIRR